MAGAPGFTASAGHDTVDEPFAGAVKPPLYVTVIIRVTATKGLPQASVAVQVSVTVPLQAGDVLKVELLDVPLIKQPPLCPLVKDNVDEAGKLLMHGIVIGPGAAIVGNAAGLTIIVLDVVVVLLKSSVKDQVSV